MDSTPILLEAIARKLCVTAVYNGSRFTLAPYILYNRKSGLYVDAVTVFRDEALPREEKIGAFKVDGLRELSLAEQGFEPKPLYDAADERYEGTRLFAVEGWPD
jgi:hypothetical protein